MIWISRKLANEIVGFCEEQNSNPNKENNVIRNYEEGERRVQICATYYTCESRVLFNIYFYYKDEMIDSMLRTRGAYIDRGALRITTFYKWRMIAIMLSNKYLEQEEIVGKCIGCGKPMPTKQIKDMEKLSYDGLKCTYKVSCPKCGKEQKYTEVLVLTNILTEEL